MSVGDPLGRVPFFQYRVGLDFPDRCQCPSNLSITSSATAGRTELDGKQTLLNSWSLKVSRLLRCFLLGFGVKGTVDPEGTRELIVLRYSPMVVGAEIRCAVTTTLVAINHIFVAINLDASDARGGGTKFRPILSTSCQGETIVEGAKEGMHAERSDGDGETSHRARDDSTAFHH